MSKIIKRIILVVICAAVLVTAVVLYRNYKADKIVTLQQYENDINELIHIKQYDEAIKLCVTAIKDYDQQPSLYILKAQAYLGNSNNSKAVGTLEYGYKQTNDKKIKTMLDSLKGDSGNEQYYSPDYNYTDEIGSSGSADITDDKNVPQRENYGEFTTTSVPDVAIPDVSIAEESSSEVVTEAGNTENPDDTINTDDTMNTEE